MRSNCVGLSLTCLTDEKLLRDIATTPSSPCKCHLAPPPWKHLLEGNRNFRKKMVKRTGKERKAWGLRRQQINSLAFMAV